MRVGHLKIWLEIADDGDMLTIVDVKGDIPFITQIGMLEMAKDTLLDLARDES